MARRIICTNENDLSITLTDQFAPWLLEACEGIYETKNKVNTSENTMTDGSTFQGSTTQMRNIILTMRDHPAGDHQANRALLYSVFKPKRPGTFLYEEDDTTRQISYYVESVTVDAAKRARQATVSLLCPDPFFVDLQDIEIQMSGWVKLFEWQHMFTSAGEEFGGRTPERLKSIENNSAADHIGLTIIIEASGTVRNPAVTHVEQAESIEIGTESNPLTMSGGDRIIITTHTNNKHVYLEQDGKREEINEYLSEDSEFLQLNNGLNTFGYSADGGESYMTVSISFRYHYMGV